MAKVDNSNISRFCSIILFGSVLDFILYGNLFLFDKKESLKIQLITIRDCMLRSAHKIGIQNGMIQFSLSHPFSVSLCACACVYGVVGCYQNQKMRSFCMLPLSLMESKFGIHIMLTKTNTYKL